MGRKSIGAALRSSAQPSEMANASSTASADQGDWLGTADVRANLKARSVRSGLINLVSQAMQVVLAIGGTMALARLLTPADFGLYAMTGILIAFIGSFRDFGLPMATVHREALNHHEYSALFWVYQRLNLLIALFMVMAAPILAWFYGRSELTAITALMALGVFALGFAVQQEALLKRRMRFGVLTAIDLIGTVLGVLAGVGAALLGAGYWALVTQFIVMCVTKAAGCWLVSSWRPSRVSSADARAAPGLRMLLSYGKDVTVASLIRHLGRNLDRVLVGYFAGAQALGLYHHADKWAHLPVKQMYLPFRSVMVSGLSRVQNEPDHYRAYVRRSLLPIFSVTLPAIAFLFVDAQRVISLLLGPQWLDAIPLFRILCVAAFFGKFSTVTKWLYLSSGETRRQLHWEAIAISVMVVAVAIGAAWGAVGVAAGFTVGTCLLVYPSIWFCLRRSHLRMNDFLRIVWRPTLASVAAATVLAAAQLAEVSTGPLVVVLALHLSMFALSYLALWVLLPGGVAAARDVLRLAEWLPWSRSTPLLPPNLRPE